MEKLKYHAKGLGRIFIFLVLLSAIVWRLHFWFLPPSVDLENTIGFYNEPANSLDAVYIGGSASFVYWEPLKAFEDYGIASYNFGVNTIQAETYLYRIQEVLKTQSPELIIIDARAFQYRDNEQPPSEVAYRNAITGAPLSPERYNFIMENVPKYLQDDTIDYHIDLFKYHSRTSDFRAKYSLKMATGKYRNSYKGFFFVPKVEPIPRYDFATTAEVFPSDATIDVLDKLLSFLHGTSQKYLFVVSPYSEKSEHKAVFNYIARRVRESGYDFLDSNDYADQMALNYDTDFYNYNHVNIYGADKYTDFLATYLQQHYQLPDRRHDEHYQEWHTLLPKWHAKVGEAKATIDNKLKEQNAAFTVSE